MFIELIFVALGIPTGFWIAYLAREELVDGRKWFIFLSLASVICAMAGVLFNVGIYISESFLFIAIVSLISLIKSRDKKWTRKKI